VNFQGGFYTILFCNIQLDIGKGKEVLELRYYTSKSRDKDGNDRFTPGNIGFNNQTQLVVNKNNPHLIYFLMKHPGVDIGDPKKELSDRPWAVLENKAAEADKILEAGKSKRLAEHQLYEVLEPNDILSIARSYKHSRLDKKTENEIKVLLQSEINRDPDEFIKRTAGKDIATKSLIQEFIDNGFIRFDRKGMEWINLDDDGNKSTSLCGVRGNEDEVERLSEYLLEHDPNDNLDYLQKKLNGLRASEPTEA